MNNRRRRHFAQANSDVCVFKLKIGKTVFVDKLSQFTKFSHIQRRLCHVPVSCAAAAAFTSSMSRVLAAACFFLRSFSCRTCFFAHSFRLAPLLKLRVLK